MQTRKNQIAWVVLALFFVIAGVTRPSQAGPNPQTPVFVVMGGYQTCPISHEKSPLPVPTILQIAVQAKKIGNSVQAKRSLKAKYFLACYSGVFPELPSGRFEFRYSPHTDFQSPDTIELNTGDFSGPEALALAFAELNNLLKETTNPVVYFIGHSYGAWTAMNAIASLNQITALGGLVTIDAISPLECKPDQLVSKSIVSFFSKTSPCTQAPKDIPNKTMDFITANAPWWFHYYQNQLGLLHSGPISEIESMNPDPARPSRGFNELIHLTGTNPIFNDYHSALAIDPGLWKNVAQWVTKTDVVGPLHARKKQ